MVAEENTKKSFHLAGERLFWCQTYPISGNLLTFFCFQLDEISKWKNS